MEITEYFGGKEREKKGGICLLEWAAIDNMSIDTTKIAIDEWWPAEPEALATWRRRREQKAEREWVSVWLNGFYLSYWDHKKSG